MPSLKRTMSRFFRPKRALPPIHSPVASPAPVQNPPPTGRDAPNPDATAYNRALADLADLTLAHQYARRLHLSPAEMQSMADETLLALLDHLTLLDADTAHAVHTAQAAEAEKRRQDEADAASLAPQPSDGSVDMDLNLEDVDVPWARPRRGRACSPHPRARLALPGSDEESDWDSDREAESGDEGERVGGRGRGSGRAARTAAWVREGAGAEWGLALEDMSDDELEATLDRWMEELGGVRPPPSAAEASPSPARLNVAELGHILAVATAEAETPGAIGATQPGVEAEAPDIDTAEPDQSAAADAEAERHSPPPPYTPPYSPPRATQPPPSYFQARVRNGGRPVLTLDLSMFN